MGKDREIHPVAALFPLLPDDELQELVEDIAERGLLQPIVLDGEGRILDGRNRNTACKKAKVEPRYETYEGGDPAGYALAVNLTRRHLSKGQRAMVAARAVLVSGILKQDTVAKSVETSQQRISQAKVVLDHAPDLADAVVSGARSLDDAYKVAQERKRETTSDEARMARLQRDAPDLADLVVEERISLKIAIKQLDDREGEKRQVIETGQDAAAKIVASLQANVTAIIAAEELGEESLVTDDMIEQCRVAIAQLDREEKE